MFSCAEMWKSAGRLREILSAHKQLVSELGSPSVKQLMSQPVSQCQVFHIWVAVVKSL